MLSQGPSLTVFRLVEIAEVEAVLDGETIEVRVEVFEDSTHPGQYRCRTWRPAEFGLHPAGFVDDDGGLDTDWETVFVPWRVPGGFVGDEPFFAPSKEAALDAVLDDLRVYLAVTRHAEDGDGPAGGTPPASA